MNMTELQKKAVAQQEKYEDAMQSVEELWDYLTPDMNNGWLSVQSSVDSMKSIILDTPEIFLKRTLLTGQDIVNLTFLEIEKYVENTIRLDFVEPISIRSEEHTSELQSLMRISYDVFCSKNKTKTEHRNM